MSACSDNDKLVRQMCAEHKSLTDIAKAVGTNRSRVKEYIAKHQIPYQQRKRGGPPGAGNGRWAGGRIIDQDGYVLVKADEHPNCNRHGYVLEHRLVMEKHLGRYLKRNEVIHHRNSDKQDNRLENLKLYPSNGDHLADTLVGQVPNWTEDGLRRIRAGVEKSAKKRRKANHN